MINRLLELSLRNRVPRRRVYLGLAGWGWWALARDADRRDSRPLRQPGHRLHRLARPQPAGGRRPGHLSADGQPPGAGRRARRPLAVGVRLLDDLRRLRGRRRSVLRARARARAHEPRRQERCRPASRRRWARTRPASATSSGTPSKARRHSLRELRTLQDWFIRYQLNAVPGVAEVASVGGYVQQYQIDVDPNRLRAYNLPLSAVVAAVRDSNLNVGGNVLESNGAWLIVRGVGLIAVGRRRQADRRSARRTACRSTSSRWPTCRSATRFAWPRSSRAREEAVGGVVVARTGVNTKEVIDAVKARIAQIAPGLPPGVTIVPFYDRSDLIEQAVDTLRTR